MNSRKPTKAAPMIVLALAIVLAIVHQDGWYWDDDTAVFGFMPMGLAYHALYSLIAAALWAFACRFAWPADLEEKEKPQ